MKEKNRFEISTEKKKFHEQYRNLDDVKFDVSVAVLVAFDEATDEVDCWINCLRLDSLTVMPDV